MVGIHILYMEGVETDSLTGGEIDRVVKKPVSAGKRSQHRRTIGTHKGVWGDYRSEFNSNGIRIELPDDEVGGSAVAISCDHDGDLFLRSSRSVCLGSTPPGGTTKMPISFLGVQEQGLINFHKSFQRRWFHRIDSGKKPMTPAERGRNGESAFLRSFANAQTVEKASGILKPLVPVVEPRQRRPRKRREHAPATLASEAGKTFPGAPRSKIFVIAPRTGGWDLQERDQTATLTFKPDFKLFKNLFPLSGIQSRQVPDNAQKLTMSHNSRLPGCLQDTAVRCINRAREQSLIHRICRAFRWRLSI